MAQQEKTEAPESVLRAASQLAEASATRIPLYGSELDFSKSLHDQIHYVEKAAGDDPGASNQSVGKDVRPHPFDYDAVARLQATNVHHAACINTKTNALVGLGFGDDEGEEETPADRALDPLTERSWADVQTDTCEDYWQNGTGFIEVVRKGSARTTTSPGATSETGEDTITGIHYLPARKTYVHVEDDKHNYHYVVRPQANSVDINEKRFARFGDRQRLIDRLKGGNVPLASIQNPELISEVIQLRQPSSIDRWYGFPDWISATASIELTQSLHQWKYDFFLNRGVPEFMLFIIGAQLPPEDWKKVEDALKANIGRGNSHKSLALNLSDPNITTELHKLAVEGKSEDDFEKLKQNLALDIVSAHRVPPLLAGILIPGKLGATNELPNAIAGFDLLVNRPNQRNWQQTLGATLGNPKLNGNLSLTRKDFRYQRLVDQLDIGAMDTVSRMREPAAGSGRDPDEGLRD